VIFRALLEFQSNANSKPEVVAKFESVMESVEEWQRAGQRSGKWERQMGL
jgi:hypothetical protein